MNDKYDAVTVALCLREFPVMRQDGHIQNYNSRPAWQEYTTIDENYIAIVKEIVVPK